MSRVLVLSAHDGWLDRRIIAEVNALADSGRELTLVTVPVRIPDGCFDRRVRIVAPNAPHPVAGRHAGLKSLLRSVSPRLYDVVRSRWYGQGKGPAELLTAFFTQTVPDEPFDAIHCHDLPTLPAAVAVAQRRGGTKVIYDSHEFFPFQFTDPNIERYWSAIEEQHIRRTDGIITVNASIAGELAAHYGVREPSVVYNSYGIAGSAARVDARQFAEHFGARGQAFTVLFQGHFDRDRNLENLILAFARQRDSARLFLLGEGPNLSELQQLRARERITNVFFGPWVAQQNLLAYTAHADLGIIPYLGGGCLNTRLCTPNKLFEFIEARVPVCASDLPELRGILTSHGNGSVFPMETPGQIAEAVLRCKGHRERGEYPPACMEAARAHYMWPKQAATLLRLYADLGI